MITMNDWQKKQNQPSSSINGDDEEDQSNPNSNALIEVNHDQFTWWYKEVFAKNMKSNRVFSASFSNEAQQQNIINKDWNERVVKSEEPDNTQVAQNNGVANGPRTN